MFCQTCNTLGLTDALALTRCRTPKSIRRGRTFGFRTISQLAISYRGSPAVQDEEHAPRKSPRAGDRLPDAPIVLDGRETWLHEALDAPAFHLLLCGSAAAWRTEVVRAVQERYGSLLRVHRLARLDAPGVLVDASGPALVRLGAGDQPIVYLVRPDGHIASRSTGADLRGAERYLARWLPLFRSNEPRGETLTGSLRNGRG